MRRSSSAAGSKVVDMAIVNYGVCRPSGTVLLPPSKSAAHRALLCAGLAAGESHVAHIDKSADMEATLRGLRALGCAVLENGGGVTLSRGAAPESAVLDCGESGSTLRFLIPIAAALGFTATFTGRGRLPERPIGLYRELLPLHGVSVETAGGLPLTVSGQLQSGVFLLPGNVSSQFITGLMLALPLLSGDSEIRLTTPLESAGYVDLTRLVLRDFGIHIEETPSGWRVPGGQRYTPCAYAVEGDWSQAAFFLSAAAVGGGPVRLSGLLTDSAQGDRACVALWRGFGLQIREENGEFIAENPQADAEFHGLSAQRIDASQIPDMVPALAVTAAFARGETEIFGAARLRIKESDRLSAMEAALSAVGADITATADGLIIRGKPHLSGGTAEGRNDHRVVMAIAAVSADCAVSVTDGESIQKSYPGFFRDFNRIGGRANGIDLG